MRCNYRILGSVVILLTLSAWSLFAAASADAAEPIRWRLTAGERLSYNLTQDMTMSMNAGPAGQMGTDFQQRMEMTWVVKDVSDEGVATIDETVDRVTMNMTAQGQSIEYDSASDDPPTGMAAMVAPMFEAMTDGTIEFKMTSRGEVHDVKVPEKMLEAIKGTPGAATMGDMATPEGFQKMLMQSALVLPEGPPTVGESTSTTTEMNNPMSGKIFVETTYTYDGTKDVDGVMMAVFRPTLKMAVEGNENLQMKVAKQSTDGELLFNQDAGRLDSINLHQTTTLQMTVADQSFDQQIDQVIKVVVAPDKEPAEGSTPVSNGATTE